MAKSTQDGRSSTSVGTDSQNGTMHRLLWVLGGVILLGGATLIAVDVAQPDPAPPPELEAVQTFAAMDPIHLAPGSPIPEYHSDPPSSGPHSPAPAPCGIYRVPVSDQDYLHSMEHGAIVIQYDPAMSQAEVEELERIVRSIGGEVILAPRPGNPSLISLVEWTNLLRLDEVDEDVIRGFDREFSNRNAPEPAASCAFQVDQGT